MQRRHRLCRGEDFQRLRREGLAYHYDFIHVRVAQNALDHNRYGFVTSKKLGNAVVRNRIKRVLREVIRHLHPQLRTGFDVMIVARQAIIGQPYAGVARIVEQALKRADLLS
ncbi:MAG: ribonuclease P protein component [Anaerolineae bacterium]|nr:ribonuclease P protein component [Anaerolineae bacterium]